MRDIVVGSNTLRRNDMCSILSGVMSPVGSVSNGGLKLTFV